MPDPKALISFEDRIAKYGLTAKDVDAEILRVGKKQVVRLGCLSKRPSFYRPRLLRAGGVDDVKNWIGTPDSVFKHKPKMADRFKFEKPPAEDTLKAFTKLHQKHVKEKDAAKKKAYSSEIFELIRKDRKELNRIAKAYVYGNSKSVEAWRVWLDWLLRDSEFPVWLFQKVVVESGAVLELDSGPNILTGDILVIEPGGTIRTSGVLTLNFSELRRSL